MEVIALVAYKPKAGKESQLNMLMKTHVDILRQEGLATNRESIVMKAQDGTILEVFGWKSKNAIEQAHSNPQVLKMWEEYAQVCDYVPVAEVVEAQSIFSEFAAMN